MVMLLLLKFTKTKEDGLIKRVIGLPEDKIKIQTLSVSEALMIMNLNEQNAILFRNSKSKKLNFLSKKNDGNISWIEPKI